MKENAVVTFSRSLPNPVVERFAHHDSVVVSRSLGVGCIKVVQSPRNPVEDVKLVRAGSVDLSARQTGRLLGHHQLADGTALIIISYAVRCTTLTTPADCWATISSWWHCADHYIICSPLYYTHNTCRLLGHHQLADGTALIIISSAVRCTTLTTPANCWATIS
ncbi:hypothetical protein J6590_029750 [Homalodisca vitripennis]|nr:hypothetical protein J6590_029750 [Homalodisca vitripennis]